MRVRTAAMCLGLLLAATSAGAQATAEISGSVRDQQGGVLPGVTVTATHTGTALSRSTVTDENGAYALPSLPVGPYRLEVALQGFRTFVQTGLVLQTGASPVINVVLEVGELTETVSVEAAAPLVETRTSTVRQVVEREQVLELPLQARDVTSLVTLGGGAVQTGSSPSQSFPGGRQISIAGSASFGVSYTLDGAMHTNPYDGTNLPLPFPDSLEEIQIESTGLSASSGMRSGGAVQAVTRSGTNLFRGSAFEFLRHNAFNAKPFFAAANDTLKRHQFGGTLGGPVLRNRVFFFVGYQNTITREDPVDTIRFVPTPAMLNGDFTAVTSPACNNGRQLTLAAPFVGNRINPAQFSPAARAIASRLPAAQNECGRITYGVPNELDQVQFVTRVDYQVTTNHAIFARYLAATHDVPPALSLQPDNILTSTAAGLDNLAQSGALGLTSVLGPNTVNALRLTFNRTDVRRTHGSLFHPRDVGVNVFSGLPDFFNTNVTGGFTIGGQTSSLAKYLTDTYQVSESLTLVRGNHQFGFGADAAAWRVHQFAWFRDTPGFTFNGQFTGLGLADFMLGRVSAFNQGSPTDWISEQTYLAAYVQDTWRRSPRLTVNYGLRWQPFLPLHLTRGAVYSFDMDRFQRGIRSTVIPNAPVGLYYQGDPGFPKDSAVERKWGLFAPRLGFAWDVSGDGSTSVRGSYGMAYDYGTANILGNSASAPPYAFRVDIASPAGGLDNPWQGVPGGNPFPYQSSATNAVFPNFGEFLAVDKHDLNPPQVHSWNLGVQRQFGEALVASATYLGNRGLHFWTQRAINPAVFIPGQSTTANTNQRRVLNLANPAEGRYFGFVNVHDDGATSRYNGLLLSVQRRAAGFTVGGNYTLSKCVDEGTSLGGAITTGAAYADPNNRRRERGPCDADRRHVLSTTAVYQVPSIGSGVLGAILADWRVSGIYRYQSGAPLNILSGQDRALTGIANQRAQQVLDDPYLDRDGLNYLNPLAFAQPALGTLGNVGRNSLVGPNYRTLDVGLSRTLGIPGGRLEFRAEAFNVTNRLNRGQPVASLSSPTFGQILTAEDPRIMQFALKYVF